MAYMVLTTFCMSIYEILSFDPAGAALNKASYGQAPQSGWFSPKTLSHTGQRFPVMPCTVCYCDLLKLLDLRISLFSYLTQR